AAGSAASTPTRGARNLARTFDDHDLAALGLDLAGAPAGAVLLGSPTCSRCPQVEQVLAEVAARTDGFRWVRVDTGEHLDLARRLKVIRVPTVLVISPAGELLARTSDIPSVDEVLAAVPQPPGDAGGHLEGAALGGATCAGSS
ncbi:MAG: thioredoxin family protein, partial [Nitriliruptoraceae bacterium]